jgi:hypothetical protein
LSLCDGVLFSVLFRSASAVQGLPRLSTLPVAMLRIQTRSAGEKTVFLPAFYTETDHFTKTGSGQA